MKLLLSKVEKGAISLGKKVLVIQIPKKPRKIQLIAKDERHLNLE